jgi:hypothetical protein
MKPSVLLIREFLTDHLCYRNRHAIEFNILEDSVLVLSVDYHNPDHQYMDFFLSYEKSIIKFISDFSINAPKDLENVTTELLWRLFRQGKGEIYCALDYSVIYFPRYYRCINSTLVAIDERNITYAIPVELKSVADFMEYTYWLYKNSSCSPQNSSFTPQSLS